MRLLISILFLVIMTTVARGQVKHNFEMDPERTDCHQITVEDKTAGEIIQEIQQRTFRFRQKINISRYRSPRSLEYASCDGKSGFLLEEIAEGKYHLYTNIGKEEWEKILSATDILEFFNSGFKTRHNAFVPE